MARARNIKPGFFTNEELVELPFSTRLLFIGLWTIADRAGRLEDRPKRIKIELFPCDDLDIDKALNELADHNFIVRYGVDGRRFIQIVNFEKHQSPHVKEADSTIPAPDEHQASTGLAALNDDSLNDESPFSDSLNDESVRALTTAVNGFERFWPEYPRKTAKQEAEKAWKKLNPSPELIETMLTALADQKTWPQWQEGFIPHPATWLRGGRWTDEKPAVRAGPTKPMTAKQQIDYLRAQIAEDEQHDDHRSQEVSLDYQNGVAALVGGRH